jgi:hypothetical protein
VSTALPGIFVALGLTGCPQGDVGAPCNHGPLENPPTTTFVTFPALSCNQLLCVYGDNQDAPPGSCNDDSDCGSDGSKFFCNADTQSCRLRRDYVLSKSMCSKKCSSDDDCKDGGVGDKVLADNNGCATEFRCQRIQALGKFCCQKMCVCQDDAAPNAELDAECEAGSGVAEACCDRTPRPEGCGA